VSEGVGDKSAQTVTPYLLYEDADAAIEFLTRAFGFREVERIVGSAGGVHAELEVHPDASTIYLGAPGGDFRGPAAVGRTSLVYVRVEDVDGHYERASSAGATIVEELNDVPLGHRRYGCRDPQGHEWYFARAVTGTG
jgi:uncharacterized glyoxalase superfamily protein PhnB